jgi:hypothetical protein
MAMAEGGGARNAGKPGVDDVDAEAESAASAGGGIGGTVLVGQSWWSASLMEEYCRGAGGADIFEYSCCGSDLPTQALYCGWGGDGCVENLRKVCATLSFTPTNSVSLVSVVIYVSGCIDEPASAVMQHRYLVR